MISRGLIALILLTIPSLVQTQQTSLTVLEPGDSLTLTCSVHGNDVGLFYWHKLNFGFMVQTIAKGSFNKMSLTGQFNNSRFKVPKEGNVYHLIIENVSKEDEGTYFCQSGTAYLLTFMNGTSLVVNDHKNQQNHVYVRQEPETASVAVGDSTTLQCSLLSDSQGNRVQCPDEHNVHWFRAGPGKSHPDVIYTQSKRSEQKERSCIYSLSKTVQNSSDIGTYYCAVVTCGQILFGEGTKVETKQKLLPLVVVLETLLLCCVIAIVVLILFRKKNLVCKHCKQVTASPQFESHRSAEIQPHHEDDETTLNYVALDFSSRKAKRCQNNREFPQNSIYSDMRQYQ